MTITVGGKRSRSRKKTKRTDYSKQMITDIRALLWVVTVGGLLLAAYCIRTGYTGALPWLSAMVGLPWTAHGVVCSNYLSMAKSDHRRGGITFESAKAKDFSQVAEEGENSPQFNNIGVRVGRTPPVIYPRIMPL